MGNTAILMWVMLHLRISAKKMNSFLIPNSSQPPFEPQPWQRCLDGGNLQGCSRRRSETLRPDTAATTTRGVRPVLLLLLLLLLPSMRPPSSSQDGAGSVFPIPAPQSYHAEHEQITFLSKAQRVILQPAPSGTVGIKLMSQQLPKVRCPFF